MAAKPDPKRRSKGPKTRAAAGRARSALAVVVGLALIGASLGFRYAWAAEERASVAFGLRWSVLVSAGVAVAIVTAWLARPLGSRVLTWGTWPLAAALAAAMPALAFFRPEALLPLVTGGAQIAGALAVTAGVLRWAQARAQRSVPEILLDPKQKVVLRSDDGQKKVTAAAIEVGDELKLDPGVDAPVDGLVVSGSGFVEDRGLTGAALPSAVRVGDFVLGGSTPTIPELVLRAEAKLEEGFLARRERRVAALVGEVFVPGTLALPLVLAPSLVTLLAAGFVIWDLGPGRPTAWLGLVATLLLTGVAAAPALAFAAARLDLLGRGRSAGLVFARVKDLDAFGAARRWQVDPQLLAKAGEVELTPIGSVAADAALGAIAALLAEVDSPEARTVRAEVERRKLEIPPGAALRRTPAVFHGTVAGARWFLGPRGALQADEGIEVPPEAEAPLDRARDAGRIAWLLGRADLGVAAVIALELAAEEDVVRVASAVSASLMPGLSDATRDALARAARVTRDGPPAGRWDAALLAEGSERPSAGLSIVVVEVRPGLKLRSGGSPRLLRPGVARLGELALHARAARRRALVAAGLSLVPPLVASALAVFGWLPPLVGGGLALASILAATGLAARPAR